MKEKWLRVALVGLALVLVILGGYAKILGDDQIARDVALRVYAEELHERLRAVKEKVDALPDAKDEAYWGNMPDNRDFKSVISEAQAVLQVMAPLAFQDHVYDVYATITEFQSAVNYFADRYHIFYYVYAPESLQGKIDELKAGIAGLT